MDIVIPKATYCYLKLHTVTHRYFTCGFKMSGAQCYLSSTKILFGTNLSILDLKCKIVIIVQHLCYFVLLTILNNNFVFNLYYVVCTATLFKILKIVEVILLINNCIMYTVIIHTCLILLLTLSPYLTHCYLYIYTIHNEMLHNRYACKQYACETLSNHKLSSFYTGDFLFNRLK